MEGMSEWKPILKILASSHVPPPVRYDPPPPQPFKKILLLCGITIGLAFIGYCVIEIVGQESRAQESRARALEAATNNLDDLLKKNAGSDEKAKSISSSIGELVKFEDSEWIVLKAQQLGSRLRADKFSEPKMSEGTFVYVRFKVKNITNEEQSVLITPAVIDSRGRRFNQLNDQFLYLPDGEAPMTLEQLPSGLPKTFSAIFELPSDATGISFLARNFKAFGKDETPVSLGF